MNSELISVIVPFYNCERYLAACIDSILSQSYRNIEVILINDGSTDFSLNVAQKYAENDDRIMVYSHPNEGLAKTRNRGLEVATGEKIMFVDSDDLLLPDSLEILNFWANSLEAEIVEGRIIKGKVLGEHSPAKNVKTLTFTPQEAIADVLYQHTLLPSMCGKLFKKELFNDLSFENGILYEDLNIFYRLIERCRKLVWVDFPVYFYRDTEGSIVNTWKPQRLDVLKVTENIEDYISEKYPDLLPAAKDRRLSANFNMFSLCTINGDRENAYKCWQHIKQNRMQSLRNPKVRLKNKAGIILSYFGRHIFTLAARRFYK